MKRTILPFLCLLALGSCASAPSGTRNVVRDYLSDAKIQYEDDFQKQVIVEALDDMRHLAPDTLRQKLYPDYFGAPERWTVVDVIHGYIEPRPMQRLDFDERFFHDVTAASAKAAIERTGHRLQDEAAPPVPRNVVRDYLSGATIQYDNDIQKQAIVDALEDMQHVAPDKLKYKRYAAYSGTPERWGVIDVVKGYILPDPIQGFDSDERFFRDVTAPSAKAAIERTERRLKDGAAPLVARNVVRDYLSDAEVYCRDEAHPELIVEALNDMRRLSPEALRRKRYPGEGWIPGKRTVIDVLQECIDPDPRQLLYFDARFFHDVAEPSAKAAIERIERHMKNQDSASATRNIVRDYLSGAEVQCEDDTQVEAIIDTLDDMQHLSPDELQRKRYPDYSGTPEQWTVIEVMNRYIVPHDMQLFYSDARFFHDVTAASAKAAIERIKRELKDGLAKSRAE